MLLKVTTEVCDRNVGKRRNATGFEFAALQSVDIRRETRYSRLEKREYLTISAFHNRRRVDRSSTGAAVRAERSREERHVSEVGRGKFATSAPRVHVNRTT